MLGLIENDKIPPWRLGKPVHAGRPLQRVDARNQPVMAFERVASPIGHVALRPEDLEVEAKNVV